MKEIKFRAWDGEKIINSWVVHKLPGFGDSLGLYSVNRIFEEKDIIWMQYTGLKDFNNKEIYEGDILRQDHEGHTVIGVMYFREDIAQFGMDAEVDFPSEEHIVSSVIPEIIGNIYENPELIPEGWIEKKTD